jgi:ribosomal protein S18 acetylase RimI-like enzyme
MEDNLITELTETEVRTDFLALMSEIEAGSWFDLDNRNHVEWLQRKISRRFGGGGRFYGIYLSDKHSLGLYCLQIEEHPVHQGYAEVLDLGVVEDYRRQGYGMKLMKDAEARAKNTDVCTLYVATYVGDEAAIEFYERCGFQKVAELPGLNGPDDHGQMYMLKRVQ